MGTLGLPKGDGDEVVVRSWIPIEDAKYDLGEMNRRWNNLYIAGTFTSLSSTVNSVTVPQGGNGYAAFNTVDQTTNYEKLTQAWNANVFELLTNQGGTGVSRPLRLGTKAGATFSYFDISRGASGPYFTFKHSAEAGSNALFSFGDNSAGNSALTASSVIQPYVQIAPFINQTGTAGYSALLINPQESGTGSGVKSLIDCQVGGVSLFQISNKGGLLFKSVANGRIGTATLVAGTITVANTSVTANSRFVLTGVGTTNSGFLTLGTVVPGTSFVISSSNAADTRVIQYQIYESF